MTEKPLVVVDELVCAYRMQSGLRRGQVIQAVDGVGLTVNEGEMFALVGESGSGKSTLGRAIVRLMKPTSGRILFDGHDIAGLRGKRLTEFRGHAQIVFQNPYQSLNPRMTIGTALTEVIDFWGRRRADVAKKTAEELLIEVHLPRTYTRKYPHELSGGQRQRVAIARAMAVQPRLLVADEPVSALDVSSSATILNLMAELRQSGRLTCIFVTHDIGLARLVSDRIAVMYQGSIVEVAPPEQMFSDPQDDYTKQLIGAQLTVGEPSEPLS